MKEPEVKPATESEMMTVRAVVTKVLQDKNYVVCQSPKGQSITFNLVDWTGKKLPRIGQNVILLDVIQYPKGLRAASAHLETFCKTAKKPARKIPRRHR